MGRPLCVPFCLVSADDAPVVEVDGKTDENEAEVVGSIAMTLSRGGVDAFTSIEVVVECFLVSSCLDGITEHDLTLAQRSRRGDAVGLRRHFTIEKTLIVGLGEDECLQGHADEARTTDDDHDDADEGEEVEVDRSYSLGLGHVGDPVVEDRRQKSEVRSQRIRR